MALLQTPIKDCSIFPVSTLSPVPTNHVLKLIHCFFSVFMYGIKLLCIFTFLSILLHILQHSCMQPTPISLEHTFWASLIFSRYVPACNLAWLFFRVFGEGANCASNAWKWDRIIKINKNQVRGLNSGRAQDFNNFF